MYQKSEVILVNDKNESVRLKVDTDIVLLILTVFSLAWIKFFIDKRFNMGIINILLMYIPFGSIIHGVYYLIKSDAYYLSFMRDGYIAATAEDAELFKMKTGVAIPYREY